MSSIAAGWGKPSRRLRAVLAGGAAAVALTAAAAAPAPAAAVPFASPMAQSMTLSFSGHSAKLVGTGAVVSVRCRGPKSGTCAGTVTLSVGGGDHRVAFSVLGGHRQSLVVPLGRKSGQSAKQRVRAVAETVQDLGACHETERFLRLR